MKRSREHEAAVGVGETGQAGQTEGANERELDCVAESSQTWANPPKDGGRMSSYTNALAMFT
jgi:hypothetical protein